MGQRILGIALLVIAFLMFVGFLRAAPKAGLLASAVAFLMAVVLPAAVGVYILRAAGRGERELHDRREALRRKTVEAEIVKLAGRREGKLTAVEVVAALAVDRETAEELLQKLVREGLAEVEVSESGVLVYSFYELRHLDEKATAKGVLDV